MSTTGPGDARRRTLRHMRDLLATAAGGAAASACATGQTQPPPVVDIQGTSAAVTVATGVPSSTGVPPKPSATAEPPDMGYGVVDPMPPPFVCKSLASSIGASAQWKKTKNGLAIEVKLGRPSFPTGTYAKTTPVQSGNGKITIAKQEADQVVFELLPNANVTDAIVEVPVACSNGQAHVNVALNGIAKGKDGAPVTVYLNDAW